MDLKDLELTIIDILDLKRKIFKNITNQMNEKLK